ncbi:MAG TPA: hypothetical protein VGU69_10475 [Rhizomicrobium sp.]|nr:hypothetical protein [Rhizomicrobium sp.]
MKTILGLALGIILLLVSATGMAQTWPDGTGAYVTHGGGQQTLNYFGICWVVTNNGGADVAIPLSTIAEWQSFIAHTPPNVALSPCPAPCGAYANGDTWTADYTETDACPAGGGSQTRTDQGTYQCNNGVVTQTGSTPLTPFDQSQCSCGGNANGSQWTGTSTNTESCTAAGYGDGATGNASQTTTTTYQCNAGVVSTVGTSTGTLDTSQCLNSSGGACVPVTASTCTALNTTQPDPICEYTAVQFGGDPFPPLPGYGWWTYYEYESTLSWTLASDACSCTATPVTYPGLIGTIQSTEEEFNPFQYPLAPPAVPNQSQPSIVPCP